MPKPRVLLAMVVAGAMAGCADGTTPTDVPEPAFDFTNNVDNGNPMISRFNTLGWVALQDDDEALFAVIATSNIEMGCHRPYQVLAVHSVQNVVHDPADPDAGKVNRVWRTKGAFITVYEGNQAAWWGSFPHTGWPPATACAELAGMKVAEGFGNYTVTDNDLFSLKYDGANHNSFGTAAEGQLERVGGGKLHFNLAGRCVFDGEDGATMKCHTKINLQ